MGQIKHRQYNGVWLREGKKKMKYDKHVKRIEKRDINWIEGKYLSGKNKKFTNREKSKEAIHASE